MQTSANARQPTYAAVQVPGMHLLQTLVSRF